jgi:hypothetical protein
MKLISIDVGIANMAVCVFDSGPIDFTIIKWDVIDLTNTDVVKCSVGDCVNKVSHFVGDNLFCKKHVTHKTHKHINLHKLSKQNLTNIAVEHNIMFNNLNKCELYSVVNTYLRKNFASKYIYPKLSNTLSLIDIGVTLAKKMNVLLEDVDDIDYVAIENQISPIAGRMKCVQCLLTQYFIMKNIKNIEYVSSTNKLKNFQDSKTSYKERKVLGIKITRDYLTNPQKPHLNKFIEWFNSHKKQDDLSDCFLQGIYVLTLKMSMYLN